MRTICIWGTSLQKVADEAQILAMIKILNSVLPGTNIVLFTKGNEILKELMSRNGLAITAIRAAYLHKVIRQLSKGDLFIVIGGPFFESPFQALTCLGLFSLAKFFRCPVITYGATVFHFKTWWGRLLFRSILNRMDAVIVRERVVVDILHDLGVKKEVMLSADPRFILDPVGSDTVRTILLNEGVNPDEPVIGLTTRYLHQDVPAWVKASHSYNDDRVTKANESIARAVAHLSEFAQVLILPLHPSFDEDVEMAKIVQKYMKDPSRLKMLSRRYTSLEIMGIIERCELLLACRLGSAVFATVTGTPLVAVAYEPRMKDHMERIHLQANVLDWKELSADILSNKVETVWFARAAERESMKSLAKEMRELAWKDADIFRKILGIPISESSPQFLP